jgi:hypothetical protein
LNFECPQLVVLATPLFYTNFLDIVENDKKKRLRNFENLLKRPLADFYHSLQVQVVKIPIKHPISSDRKKGFNEFTKQKYIYM